MKDSKEQSFSKSIQHYGNSCIMWQVCVMILKLDLNSDLVVVEILEVMVMVEVEVMVMVEVEVMVMVVVEMQNKVKSLSYLSHGNTQHLYLAIG